MPFHPEDDDDDDRVLAYIEPGPAGAHQKSHSLTEEEDDFMQFPRDGKDMKLYLTHSRIFFSSDDDDGAFFSLARFILPFFLSSIHPSKQAFSIPCMCWL